MSTGKVEVATSTDKGAQERMREKKQQQDEEQIEEGDSSTSEGAVSHSASQSAAAAARSSLPQPPSSDAVVPPAEEIAIREKRTSCVTDGEIDNMLHDPHSDATSSEESNVASLRVESCNMSLLPTSVNRLKHLQSLHILNNQLQLTPMDVDEEEKEPSNSAAAASSSSTHDRATAPQGFRHLKQLQTLEIMHAPPAPLSSHQLPSSLTNLSVCNYDIAPADFFSHTLSNLHSLKLEHIRSLTAIPDAIQVLTQLRSLTITHSSQLLAIPESLFHLPELQALDLSSNSLHALPESVEVCQKLRTFDVRRNQLLILPRAFDTLTKRGCKIFFDDVASLLNQKLLPQESDADIPQPLSIKIELEASTTSMSEAESAMIRRQSSILASELLDFKLSSPSNANDAAALMEFTTATSTTSHASKRKKEEKEHEEEDQQSKKQARAEDQLSHQSIPEEPAADAADAASATSTSVAPASRRQPGTKRKLIEGDDQSVIRVEASDGASKKLKVEPALATSYKYLFGELDYADRITSGFFDVGRKSPFAASWTSPSAMSLEVVLSAPLNYSQREVVLVDEKRDVRLQQIKRQAQVMLKQTTLRSNGVKLAPQLKLEEVKMQVRLLSCLVSDSFGGRVVVFAQHQSPVRAPSDTEMGVGRAESSATSSSSSSLAVPPPAAIPLRSASLPSPLASLFALCHNECNWWRSTSQTNVVLLCSIQHGLCRHRATLFKYLADELLDTRYVQVKLVRGFREGGVGHAWNVIRFILPHEATDEANFHSSSSSLSLPTRPSDGEEYILDTLDAPHAFRPIRSAFDNTFCYFPQFALCSSSAFQGPDGEGKDTIAEWRDLYRAKPGRLLGTGAYSQVFECLLPDGISGSCALKISAIQHLNPLQFAALLKEIRIVPQLQHKNIVAFWGYLITNTELKLFLELIRGMNLDVLLRSLRHAQQRLSVEDILVLMLELARGLEYLHQQGVLHRDVKSSQCLIGHPTLDSSGLAKSFAMKLLPQQKYPERKIVQVKRKKNNTDANAAAASSSAVEVASTTHIPSPISLVPSSPASFSFFSDAQIKLSDFNLAIPIPSARPSSDDEELEAQSPEPAAGSNAKGAGFVGTLRWLAPEQFRAPSLNGNSQSSGTQSSGAASSSLAIPQQLQLGKCSDCWSFCCVLLELLTLRIPYEEVPTEADLNAKLERGERADFAPWLDPRFWNSTASSTDTSNVVKEQDETRVKEAWKKAEAVAALSSNTTTSEFNSYTSIYDALVGLYCCGTLPDPLLRPSISSIVQTMQFLIQQLKLVKANSIALAAIPTAAAASADTETAPIVADKLSISSDTIETKKKRLLSESRSKDDEEPESVKNRRIEVSE